MKNKLLPAIIFTYRVVVLSKSSTNIDSVAVDKKNKTFTIRIFNVGLETSHLWRGLVMIGMTAMEIFIMPWVESQTFKVGFGVVQV
jgi:hypothetical protein